MEKTTYIRLFENYLRNEASEQEEQQLASILRNDKNIQYLLDNELKNASHELDDDVLGRMYAFIQNNTSSQKKQVLTMLIWKKALQWAAIIILPILSALAMYYVLQNQQNHNHPTVITAQNGEKADVMLADGSRVQLNSGSSLTYDSQFNRKQRRVHLKGEAYFEVAKDEKHPFVVQTGDMDIEALGTAFNVRAYEEEDQISAVLIEGKVKINASGQEAILTENLRAILKKSNRLLITDEVHASDFVEWTNGNLYFDNQTFDEIAQTLSRVFDVEIRFASEDLQSIRFTGTLGNSSIRNALDILSLTSAMRYEMNGTSFELYYKN